MQEKRTSKDMRFHLHPGWIELLRQGATTHGIELDKVPTYAAIRDMPSEQPDIRIVRQFHQELIEHSNLLFSIDTAKQVNPFSFGCFSVLLCSSENLVEFLRTLSEYFVVAAHQAHLSFVETNDKVELWALDNASPEAYQITKIGITLMICTILELMRQINGGKVPKCQIFSPRLDYSQLESDTFCHRYNCHEIKQGPVRKIVFSKSDLLSPLASHNNEIWQHNLTFVRKQAARLSVHDVRLQVCKVFDEQPTLKDVSVQKVAQIMLTSPRTLNRRLAEANTSFKTILNNYRLQKALHLLGNPQNNMTEIAFQLGFSELSSFSRAFKRWTGEAPSKAH
ncbi:helix-turn-helix transcriptional regulator [Vibrio sp. CAU 1672]|uniref:helix-turn-helix transcriptional regulator n=1 Tax=Vibrio sp. CAU 1672 TaxID=3032594 RepID=UPI0023DB52D8|nr:helix-turn-helix transcriptional regulator [Vibrio sp. CAU 1672]MDF2152812.1 helix-turn-helix transcriptional regulator [Vibrio sp. CAU 1672]